MASSRYTRLLRLIRSFANTSLVQAQNGCSKPCTFSFMIAASGVGMAYAYTVWLKCKRLEILPVAYAKNQEEDKKEDEKKVSYREARFQQFASVEYGGSIFMTPQDFLESVIEEIPRPRIGRLKLSHEELEGWLRTTPKVSMGNNQLFRSLHNKGIISYTEYLFLLCVLTKPHSGFRIAFNMFDRDGNAQVDKREFLMLQQVFGKAGEDKGRQQLLSATDQRDDFPDTTLIMHFFGPKGKHNLKYPEFHKFMTNLQREVIELEFMEFSRGMRTISEVSFAKILLRFTDLSSSEMENCLKRVRSGVLEQKGITLEDFYQFCEFLNNLDDFALSIKMYTFSQKSVSQEDFQRAVKVCTGYTLHPHVVDTVFKIFDSDGDGNLSHEEFISIMKDRIHRGARAHLMHSLNSWGTFRSCVKNQMKSL